MFFLKFLKTLSITILISSSSLACDLLSTGHVVTDKYRNGTTKQLKSISSLTDTYGDNSPIYNLLISKDTIKKHKWDTSHLSVETKIKSGSLDLKKQTHNVFETWKDDDKFLHIKDFDADKFKEKVFGFLEPHDSKLLATSIELSVMYKNKLVCTQKLSIDTH